MTTSDRGPAGPFPDAGDVRALARLVGLPVPDAEVEAVVVPLRGLCAARALIDGWRDEDPER